MTDRRLASAILPFCGNPFHLRLRLAGLGKRAFMVPMVAALLGAASLAHSEVRLPSVFSDGMVLQRDTEVPVWGWASPGENVRVKVGDATAETTSNAEGRWMVHLGPLPAGGPHTLTVSGSNVLTVNDVLVGEVWLCSGQSWMTWDMGRVQNSEEEIANANSPEIRMFTAKKYAAIDPQDDCEGAWTAITPQTARPLSALAYFFGRTLQAELGVPIGLIHSSVPGTVAWAWTPREALLEKPELKEWLDATDQLAAEYGSVFFQEHGTAIREWLEASGPENTKVPNPHGIYASHGRQDEWRAWLARAEQDAAADRPVALPPEPQAVGPKQDPRYHAYRQTTTLFNGMIHPLIPYGIAGTIWFQGTGGEAFLALINSWRSRWGWDFPFFFVQLPNYEGSNKNPEATDLAVTREGQAAALGLPNTGMAVAIDIGKVDDLHPTNMQDYADRLSRIALAKVYDRDIEYSGPVFENMTVEGDKIRIRFQHVGAELVAKGGEPLKGFTIAGADGKFVAAEARIDGDTVLVSHPEVPQPKHVRYAFANAPDCNLYNQAGLPAAPFRTDVVTM